MVNDNITTRSYYQAGSAQSPPATSNYAILTCETTWPWTSTTLHLMFFFLTRISFWIQVNRWRFSMVDAIIETPSFYLVVDSWRATLLLYNTVLLGRRRLLIPIFWSKVCFWTHWKRYTELKSDIDTIRSILDRARVLVYLFSCPRVCFRALKDHSRQYA